jgi:hypothetical protein
MKNYCNRSRAEGFPLKAGFKGYVHRKPACGSEADIPPSGQKYYAGQVVNSAAFDKLRL